MAKKIQSEIRRFSEKGVLNEAEALSGKWKSMATRGTRGIGIGGFTRFRVYKTDFGWGRPVKVEIATVDMNGLITMAEGREGNGGVELGLLPYKNELDLFASSFRDAIQGLHWF
ncbi:phenolic glucoside malonyltransferase 2-like [Neltuma alba]|uniref:phenolic glucoside malonyltransferase 2-like n=1 Tax=Neltuma alba TaxID=207710 RepID=UPI0010A355FB|nr:phenolic glucoside malonyltransferase 2-like [Prosopis alba]